MLSGQCGLVLSVAIVVAATFADAFQHQMPLAAFGVRPHISKKLPSLIGRSVRQNSIARLAMQDTYTPRPKPILDGIEDPVDMKKLSMPQLKQLCDELRWEVIESVSKTGGHLSSSLGVTELTVALHYVFEAPEDKIVWDVAHQCYPHKMLTGRRHRFPGLRQWKGISGFTKRAESE